MILSAKSSLVKIPASTRFVIAFITPDQFFPFNETRNQNITLLDNFKVLSPSYATQAEKMKNRYRLLTHQSSYCPKILQHKKQIVIPAKQLTLN